MYAKSRFFVAKSLILPLLVAACEQHQPARAFPTAPTMELVPGINDPDPMNAAALAAAGRLMTNAPVLEPRLTVSPPTFQPSGNLAVAAMVIDPPAIIANGTVQLGVNPTGNLNVPGGTLSTGSSGTTFVGLRYLPTGGEATAPGCLCEGWGVADAATGLTGYANIAADGGARYMVVESFVRTATEATSIVNVQGKLRVTHAYKPVASTPNLYEAEVTIENISPNAIADLRYRRVMDWDISPNTFSEYVTIQGTASATDVLFASDNGFASANPLAPRGGLSGDFVDSGPADHGALFDFKFGSLDAAAKKTFKIYYGAAGTESDALAALGIVGAEVYSFGQANWNGTGDFRSPGGAPPGTFGKTTGQPHTFIFAFKGVGGVIVVPPPNQSPVSNPGGPYTSTEGSAISFDGTSSSDPDGDALTYKWDFDNDGTVDATTATASHTYPDNGSYTAKLTVEDGKGGTNSVTVGVTVTNVAPTGVFANTAPVDEGSSFGLSLSAITDPGASDVAVGFTFAFDCGGGAGYGAYGASASIACPTADNATRTVRGKVRDKDGGETEYTGTAVVNNVAPSLGPLSVPSTPLALQQGGTPVTISASFTDPGTLDTHTGTLACDGGTPGAVTASTVAGTGTASGQCTFTAAGVYTISMTVNDDDGGTDSETALTYVVVYDPSGGFVTGGGWIDSPAGSYSADDRLTGKATFGFVSKYQKGATVPTGNTEFQFHAASLVFHSDTYQWLVIAGANAQYKGTGSIAGRPGTFGFLLTAIDGDVAGGGGVDKLRIKIWDVATSVVVYDNKLGQAEDSSEATALGGGNISIKAK
jgi:PKD repeat protein